MARSASSSRSGVGISRTDGLDVRVCRPGAGGRALPEERPADGVCCRSDIVGCIGLYRGRHNVMVRADHS